MTEVLQAEKGKQASEITQAVDKMLAGGDTKAAREEWIETQVNSNCTSSAGNLEQRTCYRVNHGDGTYSPTWCGNWACQ